MIGELKPYGDFDEYHLFDFHLQIGDVCIGVVLTNTSTQATYIFCREKYIVLFGIRWIISSPYWKLERFVLHNVTY